MGLTSSLLKMFFGSKADRDSRAIEPIVEQIRKIYPTLESMSHDQLRDRIQELRISINQTIAPTESQIQELRSKLDKQDTTIDQKEKIAAQVEALRNQVNEQIEAKLLEILPEVFAIVKDTARRFAQNDEIDVRATDADRALAAVRDVVRIEGDRAIYSTTWTAGGNTIKWDMIHYDVQLFGGVALHKGNIAEMATGEGKTLVATLPVFLNAMAGKGVHVVTVNDYLSRRDSEWMGPLYQFHGLTVDCIDRHRPGSAERRNAYLSDITFGTNNEFGFDYLRDNMAIEARDLVQREHHFAIVDEVDSVLIDDARTPLIISGPVPKGDDQLFEEYQPYVENLYSLQKNLCTQLLSEAKRLITSGDTEKGGLLLYRAHKGLPKSKPLIKFLSEQGVKALMLKTENFYMQDNSKRMGEVTDDLYFVIDEKNNGVELTDKGHDELAKKVGERNFFVLPDIGAEVANLEKGDKTDEEKLEVKDRLLAEYAAKSERVHTVSQLLKAYSVFEKDVEYVVMDNKVKIVDEQTGRIMDGRRYSDGLHQAIEAKEHVKVEAATQTFATVTLQNYFRMYHKLSGMTGTAETEASELWDIYKLDVIVIPTNRPISRLDRQDVIYKTKREKYAAVIDQTVEMVNQGRPVLVGTTSVEISELLSKMLKLRGIKHNVLNAKQHQSEAMIVAEAGRPGQVTIATNMAGRGTDIKLAEAVKQAGGLAIIGTERHESRRVDRQLRGRSGRQGDPGSSQFFVSLEDDLMRLFGSERIAKMMDTMGIKDGESIQAGMMTKAIERAQKKVEENNFGVRKRLLEYDDVMNSQREVIYTRRRHALFGEQVDLDIHNIINDYAEAFVENNRGGSIQDFNLELIKEISVELNIAQKEYDSLNDRDLIAKLVDAIADSFARRTEAVAMQALPVLENIKAQHGDAYQNVAIPITDGIRVYNIPVNINRTIESHGAEIAKAFSRVIMLLVIDDNWKEHLRDMDDLKQSVQNATYEQKDPLLIYKFESFNLFKSMLGKVNKEVLSVLMKMFIPITQATEDQNRQEQAVISNTRSVENSQAKAKSEMERMQASRQEAAMSAGAAEKSKPSPVHVEKTVGRNEPCPCGSGKKYKSCHGQGK